MSPNEIRISARPGSAALAMRAVTWGGSLRRVRGGGPDGVACR